jgi:hypothetical protein
MTKESSTEFPYQATATFKNKYLRAGKHIAVLPMDDTLAAHIGRVTAYWCFYETGFNLLIGQMLAGAEREEPNWQRRNFKKRTELTRELLGQVTFPNGDDEGKRRIRACLDTAADLQWRRNAIVHGSYRTKIAAQSSAVIFYADATHNGSPVTVTLDPETLEKLFHDIAHLMGEFIQIAKLLGTAEELARAYPDKLLLDLSRETDQTNPPTQQMS